MGDKSSIVNILIMVGIVVLNIFLSFFIVNYILKKSLTTFVENQKIQMQQLNNNDGKNSEKQAKNSDEDDDDYDDYDDDDDYDNEENGGKKRKVPRMKIKEIDVNSSESFELDDIYANIDGRFLVITMTLKFSKKDQKKLAALLPIALPEVRANILGLLRREEMENLEDVNYEATLKKKIKRMINKMLPEGKIDEVLFTQYLIQG